MRFSIVICTYNRAKYLRQTLESIIAQRFDISLFEIVVVDNNSPDDTAAVMEQFMISAPEHRIRYLKETQPGVSYARNKGVSEAEGEYIVFIDDDETVGQDFLEHINTLFSLYPQAELCAEPVVPVYEVSPPKWLSPYTEQMITGAYNKGKTIKALKTKDYPGTGHATFRRELFFRYGNFDVSLGRKGNSLLGGEDKDFFLRLITNGVKCYYVPGAVIYHHTPEYKLTDAFFDKLSYAIGQSERIRTKNLSIGAYRKAYHKRLFSELVKWGGTLVLFVYYTITFRFSKGWKLVRFRKNVTRGLLSEIADNA